MTTVNSAHMVMRPGEIIKMRKVCSKGQSLRLTKNVTTHVEVYAPQLAFPPASQARASTEYTYQLALILNFLTTESLLQMHRSRDHE